MTEEYTDLITGKPIEHWAQEAMSLSASRRLRALAVAFDCSVDDVDDVISEVIADSIDMDWSPSVGASAILRFVRDRDRSGEADETQSGSAEGKSPGPQDIAQPQPEHPHAD